MRPPLTPDDDDPDGGLHAPVGRRRGRERRRQGGDRRRGRRRVSARLRKGAYLLPSLFTIGAILLGFSAIIQAVSGKFSIAALLIFGAGFLDALDGRIARLTHTESEFGRIFDSLSDVLTFGMAPALLTWFWGLQDFGRIGWLAPFFFLVCCATRLARFTVQTRIVDSRFFIGLPAPAAGGVAVSFAFLPVEHALYPQAQQMLLFTLLILGTLMVSTFRYPSGKKVDLRRRRSYRMALPLAAMMLAAAWRPIVFLAATAWLYALLGPLLWLRGRVLALRRRDRRRPMNADVRAGGGDTDDDPAAT
ncbi:MAG: CDP-diacylglycerol--serine O-phosphatidyltransferase, partial [Acidobacteriota bacterium]